MQTGVASKSSVEQDLSPPGRPSKRHSSSLGPAHTEEDLHSDHSACNGSRLSAGPPMTFRILRFGGADSDVRPPRMRRVDWNSESIQPAAPVESQTWPPADAPAPSCAPALAHATTPVPAPAPAPVLKPVQSTRSKRGLAHLLNHPTDDENTRPRAKSPCEPQASPSRFAHLENKKEEQPSVAAPAPRRARRTLQDLLNPDEGYTPPWGLCPSDPSRTDYYKNDHTPSGARKTEKVASFNFKFQTPIVAPLRASSTASTTITAPKKTGRVAAKCALEGCNKSGHATCSQKRCLPHCTAGKECPAHKNQTPVPRVFKRTRTPVTVPLHRIAPLPSSRRFHYNYSPSQHDNDLHLQDTH